MNNTGHVVDLLPAYALDCLDDDDLAFVAEHLAGCADCRQELAVYQQVADDLPLALAQTPPPPELKRRLMTSINTAETDFRSTKPDSWWGRISNSFRRSSPAWGLASLAIVILLAVSNLLLWRQVNQIQPNQMPVVALQGTDYDPNAVGTIVISRDGEHGALIIDGLKPLGEDQQYQLWLIKNGARTSGAVFSVDEFGYAARYVNAPEPLISYESLGITIEPAGGSPAPTGKKVMGGDL